MDGKMKRQDHSVNIEYLFSLKIGIRKTRKIFLTQNLVIVQNVDQYKHFNVREYKQF